MYLPYVRGKQNELIGIRESLDFQDYEKKVSPIIEPVSKTLGTMKKTIKELIKKGSNFTLIINPQVGFFHSDNNFQVIFDFIADCLADYDNFQIGVIFHRNIDHKVILRLLEANKEQCKALTIVHNSMFEAIEPILSAYSNVAPIKYNVLNLDYTTINYQRRFNSSTLVEFKDYFKAQDKNVLYMEIEESNFSDKHLLYRDGGIAGFSDYLTIGSKFSEGGGPAFAVAIHISYIGENKVIRVKHFVSESNEDSSNVAGKFAEALGKLEVWHNSMPNKSKTVDLFIENYKEHYPGLGALKKLTLMNHIELILQLI